ncbi:hypothetical protein ACJX0J_040677 [Zea mays]
MDAIFFYSLDIFQIIQQHGMEIDVSVSNALMTHYSKNQYLLGLLSTGIAPDSVHGYIFQRFDDAFRAFTDILNKDSISWNAILSACATSEQHIENHSLECYTHEYLLCFQLAFICVLASLEDIHLEGALNTMRKWDGVENVRKLMKHLFIASDINHQDRKSRSSSDICRASTSWLQIVTNLPLTPEV